VIETEPLATDNDANQRPLPDGWRWVRLGEIGEFISGGTPSKDRQDFWSGGIPFVTGADVTDFYIEAQHARAFLTEHGFNSGKTAQCRPNNLLIVTRTRVGRVGIATEIMGASQDITAYVCGPKIHPDFACWYLKSLANAFIAHSRGSTILGLTRDYISQLLIPLPPLAEQQRIAAILAEQMAAVERARTATEAQLAAARDLPAAFLREVFESDEAGEWIALGEALALRKDVVHPYNNPSGKAIFVGLEHIESHTGKRIGSIELDMSTLTGRKPRFFKGDIVYGYLRPYLNKVWLAEFDGLCSVDQYVYIVDAQLASAEYIAWFMRSPLYLATAPIKFTPGQLPRVRTEEVATVKMPLPSLDEQRRIVAMLNERMASAETLRATLEAQLDAIDILPAALLRQAFNGEI
jgi:restriction endonuclease S subunit